MASAYTLPGCMEVHTAQQLYLNDQTDISLVYAAETNIIPVILYINQ